MSATLTTERLTIAPVLAESFTTPAPGLRPPNFIKRHPVLAFYVLAFAICWGGILLVVSGPGNFPGTSAQVGKLFLSVMLTWLAGPQRRQPRGHRPR